MILYSEIASLLRKELTLEWRRRTAFNGILLYIISTVFVCYLAFNAQTRQLNEITWNALFWIILLFTAFTAIAKSFSQEPESRQLYYYTLASPQGIIFSKIIYNAGLMLTMALSGYFFYSVVMGNPVQDKALFTFNMLLGSVGFSSCLTMISGIASKAGNNSTLMAVLGFPVVLPMLLMLMKVSKNAMDGLARSASYEEISTLLAINLIVIAVSYLLFPYLWKS